MRPIGIPERGEENLRAIEPIPCVRESPAGPYSPDACACVRPSGTRAGVADARGGADDGGGGAWATGAMTRTLKDLSLTEKSWSN